MLGSGRLGRTRSAPEAAREAVTYHWRAPEAAREAVTNPYEAWVREAFALTAASRTFTRSLTVAATWAPSSVKA